jgi:hypothetical protein
MPLQINKNALKRPLEKMLTECSNAVFIGLAATKDLKDSPEFLMGQDNFQMYSPFFQKMPLDKSKLYFQNWVVKKGVEDLIKGVFSMLIEVVKTIKKVEAIKEIKPTSLEELEGILNDPFSRVDKKSFPNLIDLIKPYLNEEMTYLNEIKSINRIRRCLVHRDGLVTSIDVQEGEENLVLLWRKPEVTYEASGQQKPLGFGALLTGDMPPLNLSFNQKRKEFKLNESIEIDYELFNEIIWTCQLFGDNLIANLDFGQVKK